MSSILPDRRFPPIRIVLLVLALACSLRTSAASPVIRHAMTVTITPAESQLAVEDRITLPRGGPITFSLHAALVVHAGNAALMATRREGPRQYYRLTPAAGAHTVTMRYRGKLPVGEDGTGIDRDSVYLDSAHAWFPRFDDERVAFSLDVRLPRGWTAISQGRRAGSTWSETHPQQDIYLVAARFHQYARPTQNGNAMIFLRQPDPALAERYLAATRRYLAFYSRLIGPYPYAKFALVENDRDTGFGMPSFTLLGARVIRLPFIIDTSYPHEILHNWWGNGVYVRPGGGNWAEALTSYLADHLLAEQAGRGEDYRLSALLQYADYVSEARDFPLGAFHGNHGEVSQAIGYNKGLMFFHMLRLRIGDARFLDGVRRFYREYRFRPAGYRDIRAVMEAASGEKLDGFFEQWITRAGAPRLALSDVRTERSAQGYRLRGVLRQTQDGDVYDLRVPIAIALEGRPFAQETTVTLTARRGALDIALPARPLRIEVDPRVDLFRWIDPAERPPSLAQLFASERPLFVLPAKAPATLRAAYGKLVAQWAEQDRYADVVLDDKLPALQREREIWILGWENRFREEVTRALPGDTRVTASSVTLNGQTFPRAGRSVVAVARARDGRARGLLATDDADALPRLAHRLPHYDQYSYLVFEGEGPENVRKGRWPITDSPLKRDLGAGTARVTLPARPPLAAAAR